MKLQDFRNSLMTKALTLLGFSSPLALMACYGTPTTDYPTEAYVDTNELNGQKGDSTKLSVVAEGKWKVVVVPDFVSVSQDSGEGFTSITVKAIEDNLTNELREGEIVISDDNGTRYISIAQLPAAEEVVEEEAVEE